MAKYSLFQQGPKSIFKLGLKKKIILSSCFVNGCFIVRLLLLIFLSNNLLPYHSHKHLHQDCGVKYKMIMLVLQTPT